MNKLMKRDGLNKKGFTLVELIVVIAILGVLMVVLVPQYIQYVEKSRIGVDESYIGEVAHSMELSAAGEESLYGASFAVTIDNFGKYTVAPSALTDKATAAQVTTMKTALDTVFPDNETTNKDKVIYKSKRYKEGATITIALSAKGKATWTPLTTP